MLTWFIKVNIALAVFWIVYRLCFGRDTLFPLRRATLWIMALFALAWSLIVITVRVAAVAVPFAEVDWTDMSAMVVDAPTEPSFKLWMIPLGVYLLGVAVFLIRFLMQLARIIALGLRSRKTEIYGTEIRVTAHPSVPFSFFGWIFVDPAEHSDMEIREILTHEQTHVRERHSVDVLFFELLRIAFWANPFAWLMKSSVLQNLEYLADKDVIRRGSDRRQYQYRLLQLSYQQPLSALTNHFSKSQLKNRIAMMNKEQTSRRGIVKYALILPLIFSMLLLANVKTMAVYADSDPMTVTGTVRDVAGNPIKAVSVVLRGTDTGTMTDENGRYAIAIKPGVNDVLMFSRVGLETVEWQAADKLIVVMKESTTTIDAVNVAGYPQTTVPTAQVVTTLLSDGPTVSGDEPFLVVEDMPKFQGGDLNAFRRWAMTQVKYPKKAHDAGIQGRVILSFIVEKDGTVGDVEVVSKTGPLLNAEAVRVVSSSPRWEPGMQREQAVRVKFNVPIDFKLKDSPGKASAHPEDEVFYVVEDMPKFRGGDFDAFRRWVASSIRYPEEAMNKNAAGQVVVSFVVEEDGSVGDVKVVGSVNPLLDAEAVRVVSSSPRWEPGRQRDMPVRVKFNLPVNFGRQSSTVVLSSGTLLKSKPMTMIRELDPNNPNKPLFIIDGYEVSAEEINGLETDVIESITVLKDAASKKVYRDKGVNGVVVIETKKSGN